MTRAASGIERFDELLEQTKEKPPARALVTPEQIGNAVAALAADWVSIITGEVLHLDGRLQYSGGFKSAARRLFRLDPERTLRKMGAVFDAVLCAIGSHPVWRKICCGRSLLT
jgi:Enoyl-(Acyl carrier protein) reductase